MVSEIEDVVAAAASEVWVPEFGLLETKYIEDGKKYQGRLYRLSANDVKTLSELVGFTAKFDSPSIRSVYLDVLKTEGNLWFEIDRNTSPTELSLRYSRDRWSTVDVPNKPGLALRPWLKTQYVARFLPEKVLFSLTEQLKIKFDERDHFYMRINFRDKTVGLIAEDAHVEKFPAGAFQVFALPEGHVAAIPAVEVVAEEPQAARSQARPSAALQAADSGIKFATYSQSEIDRMLKQQTENITNTLGAKISGQQRSFLEAVEAQERAIGKISDRLATQLEEIRVKYEAQANRSQESTRSHLAEFHTKLNEELDQFRSHVNKNILPVPKAIEEKVKALELTIKSTEHADVRPAVIGMGVGVIVAVLVSASVLMFTLAKAQEVTELKGELQKLSEKVGR